jgi:hypothetical protein
MGRIFNLLSRQERNSGWGLCDGTSLLPSILQSLAEVSIKALTTVVLALINAVFLTIVSLWGQNAARMVHIALPNTNVAIQIALPLGRVLPRWQLVPCR